MKVSEEDIEEAKWVYWRKYLGLTNILIVLANEG